MNASSKQEAPNVFYRALHEKYSLEERHKIAHFKRFFECVHGLQSFQDTLIDRREELPALLKEYGIDIPVNEIPVMTREEGFTQKDFNIENWPALKLYSDWNKERLVHHDLMRTLGETPEVNPRFDLWRKRQINRCRSELSHYAHEALYHGTAAIELSQGCSIGCWFCGISAESYEGNFTYTNGNIELWQDSLRVLVDILGPATGAGICYWGTDPTDNPDYFKLILDFEKITGILPPTTTAAAHKDNAWSDSMVKYTREYYTYGRFSILTPKIFKTIIDTYTADDLIDIDLFYQGKDSKIAKAESGRVIERIEKESVEFKESLNLTDQATIACISGFLINMVSKKVQLMSPCRASNEWPLGFRVYAEGHFNNAKELRQSINKIINDCMPEKLSGDAIIRFRKDLAFENIPNGFTLTSPVRQHTLTGTKAHQRIGEIISEGPCTVSDVTRALIQEGVDIFLAADLIQKLYEAALIEETIRN
jgi:radical SAM family RiPP maturation amino acid epimerase